MAKHQLLGGHFPEVGILRCFAKTKNPSASISCGLFQGRLLIVQKTSGRIKACKCRSALSRRGSGSVCYFFFTGSQTYSPLSSSPVNRPSRLVLLIARSSRVWAPTIPKRHQNGSNCRL